MGVAGMMAREATECSSAVAGSKGMGEAHGATSSAARVPRTGLWWPVGGTPDGAGSRDRAAAPDLRWDRR